MPPSTCVTTVHTWPAADVPLLSHAAAVVNDNSDHCTVHGAAMAAGGGGVHVARNSADAGVRHDVTSAIDTQSTALVRANVCVGRVVSSTSHADADATPLFPAASRAVTTTVWLPSSPICNSVHPDAVSVATSPMVDDGAGASTAAVTTTGLASVTTTHTDTLPTLTNTSANGVMVTMGGTVSTTVTATGSGCACALPAASTARMVNTCSPSARPAYDDTNRDGTADDGTASRHESLLCAIATATDDVLSAATAASATVVVLVYGGSGVTVHVGRSRSTVKVTVTDGPMLPSTSTALTTAR